jgi:hypothetical protein
MCCVGAWSVQPLQREQITVVSESNNANAFVNGLT